MKPVVIAGYARSPFTLARKGELARVRPDDLAAAVVRGLIARTGVDAAGIEDLILGCAFPEGEQGFNLGRIMVLLADLPISVAGTTVNRWCGSSMQALHFAAGQIQLGAGEAFICAGVESMSRVPMMGFNPLPNAALAARKPETYMGMGETAENVARRWGISRRAQEEFAVRSHVLAEAARAAGRLAEEIVPISNNAATISQDGCIRADTTLDTLAGLKLAFAADGSITAGTASPLTDGAAALLVCAEEYADARGLPKLARLRAVAVAGCAPEIMGIGPVAATRKALARAGLAMSDIDLVELNEAFAAQALACMQELGIDPARVNLDGGALALGHPLGATGARITGKAAALLHRTGAKFALATQCIGGGQGIATILERI